ncbi:hypothetical protein CC1G_03677 [Coprinopsis cinerea okayama7|uniref:UTP23 sensor motif region domain-containing protein n=1 Tax=Coprinopsis cinerea (strain Okayama-7 / 130 / ATCC MYA-4618 / FGSC 9003) TaxID=240176 RepID=A8N1Y4_COPC7|nr:hypothetical protein CC1G_03677 [Coprinopsis cinerea okayama7\|eukprot:XP_001828883.2 hypothetical protein CC1G_03677 [Coprinopsis cinerea okayama7\
MAISHKFDIAKQLSTVAQGEVKLMITQCCIHSLYLAGKSQQPAVDLAKTFERRKCNHRDAIDPDDCLKDVVGEANKHRYVIVTQSQPLRNHLRRIPATPIIHINRSVMVLEPPSDATLRAKLLAEEKSLHASGSDLTLVQATAPKEEPKKKKKGPKGPNPLSVKKKKTQPTPPKAKTSDNGKNSSKGAELGKRKREEDDDHDDVGGDHAGTTDGAGTTGEAKKKRKRRRKAKQTSEPDDMATPATSA